MFSEEHKREVILKHEIAHALDGLLDVYDICRGIQDERPTCDEIWDLVNDGAVDVFRSFVWEAACNEARRQKKVENELCELRKETLLRRLEQVCGISRNNWSRPLHLIKTDLPPMRDVMNLGKRVMNGYYNGWSAEELRLQLAGIESLRYLAPDAEKFVH